MNGPKEAPRAQVPEPQADFRSLRRSDDSAFCRLPFRLTLSERRQAEVSRMGMTLKLDVIAFVASFCLLAAIVFGAV